MIGSVMKKKEIRSFIYILESKDGSKVNVDENTDIGTVELNWQNTFGDVGGIMFGPFIYINDA